MEYLYELNNMRKLEVNTALAELEQSTQPFAPFIYLSNARPGILGLIAQKLLSQTGTPVFVVKCDNGSYHGSGRSPEWYPCLSQLSGMSGVFVGGHEGAFGCGFDNIAVLENVCDFLEKDVPAVLDTVEVVEEKPDIVITTDWSSGIGLDIAMFEDYLFHIKEYAPFGKGFPAPVIAFVFNNSDVISPDGKASGWETMGKARQHLKIHFANGFDVICWNQAYLMTQKDSFDRHTVIGQLKFTEFRGVWSIIFEGSLVEQ